MNKLTLAKYPYVPVQRLSDAEYKTLVDNPTQARQVILKQLRTSPVSFRYTDKQIVDRTDSYIYWWLAEPRSIF